MLPRILEKLLHAQRDAAIIWIDCENDRLDFVARLDQLRRMLHPLRPGHFRNVDEAFNTLLKLNECAVIGYAENAATHASANRIALYCIEPRIRRELLEAERDALLVFVELQDLDLDLVADVDQIARVRQPAP